MSTRSVFTVLFALSIGVGVLSVSLSHGLGGSVLITDFAVAVSKDDSNSLPKGWSIKVWQGRPDVKIIREDGRKVLRMRSDKASVAIYRAVKLNLKNFPVLTWRWKVTRLPKNADARFDNRDDQAAGVFVVFPRFPSFINSQVIGYIWGTSVPEGTILRSRKSAMVHYIVVRSGMGKLDRWITEKRNVLDDYRRVFGQDPPMVGGISLTIDSDDTRSQAESYFARIEFNDKSAVNVVPSPNRIVRYLKPFLIFEG